MKIFNRIRQHLLTNGQLNKYLIYAIGEIILVVIGILIALWINNLNEKDLEINAERNFYKNIKHQLLSDVENINSLIVYNSAYTDQFHYAIDLIESNNRLRKDSLCKIAINLTDYSDFDRQGNIYETMVNSGEIKIVRNQEIIGKLRRLEETFIYINRLENVHFDVILYLVPDLMNSIRYSELKVEDIDYLYSFKCQNLFVISLRIMKEKEDVYLRALSEIKNITALLDQELD